MSQASFELPKKRRLHWHVFGVVVVWLVIFVANEAHRVYIQNQILADIPSEQVILQVRFPTLNRERCPSLLPQLGRALGGEYWNHDIVAVEVIEPEEELLTRLARLQRLSNLQIRYRTLTERQVRTVCGMTQLQWLLLGTDQEEPAIDRFRAALPRTYVSY